jgi:hypothetical protein
MQANKLLELHKEQSILLAKLTVLANRADSGLDRVVETEVRGILNIGYLFE